MKKPPKPLSYPAYLCLDTLLDCQKLMSGRETRAAAHDEMLFIVVHQTYELWFKQILHELDSILVLFQDTQVDDTKMGCAVARLHRIIEIEQLLIHQIEILETMTALDFLDFRDDLFPASGFQSVQFRLLEAKLGLREIDRVSFSRKAHLGALEQNERVSVERAEQDPSLFDVIERWLERIPFLDFEGFHFWQQYRAAVEHMLAVENSQIVGHPNITELEKTAQLEQLEATRASFEAILDESLHQQQREVGKRRLSHRAMQAALFIHLYNHYPVLQVPHRLLTQLVDMDEHLTTWRHRHALMAHRMIGRKIGTGGSLGYRYLKSAAERHKVFTDFFDLSTYLLPRSALPELPREAEYKLGFSYQERR